MSEQLKPRLPVTHTDHPPVVPIPQSAQQSVPPKPSPNCSVERTKDGGMTVHFKIDPLRTKRLLLRAGTMDPATYLWENVINRAVEADVF